MAFPFCRFKCYCCTLRRLEQQQLSGKKTDDDNSAGGRSMNDWISLHGADDGKEPNDFDNNELRELRRKIAWNRINQNKEQKTEWTERWIDGCIRRYCNRQTDRQEWNTPKRAILQCECWKWNCWHNTHRFLCSFVEFCESNRMNNDQPHSAKCNCYQRLLRCFLISSIRSRWPLDGNMDGRDEWEEILNA